MIKNKLYLGLALMLAVLVGCQDEPGDYFEYEKAFTEITFEDYPGFSGTFTSLDDIQITVNSSNENVSQLQVFRNISYTDAEGNAVSDRDLLTTLDVSGGQGTLDVSLEEVFEGTEGTAGNLNELTFDFVAEQNGQSTFKRFDASVIRPLTFEGPETAFSDSTVVFAYEAATMNETISTIEFFTRTDQDEDFSAVADETVTINDLSGEGEFEFTMPSGQDVPPGGSAFVRARITTAQGRTFTVDREVEAEAVPLGETQSATLAVNDRGFSLIDQVDTVAADADVLLDVQGGLFGGERLVLRAGGDSNTEFVRASAEMDFADASFEDLRDEFDAGMAAGETTDLVDLSTAPSDAVYIVRMGNVPAGAAEDSRRYAVMRLVNLTIAEPLEASTATIEYRVKAEEE